MPEEIRLNITSNADLAAVEVARVKLSDLQKTVRSFARDIIGIQEKGFVSDNTIRQLGIANARIEEAVGKTRTLRAEIQALNNTERDRLYDLERQLTIATEIDGLRVREAAAASRERSQRETAAKREREYDLDRRIAISAEIENNRVREAAEARRETTLRDRAREQDRINDLERRATIAAEVDNARRVREQGLSKYMFDEETRQFERRAVLQRAAAKTVIEDLKSQAAEEAKASRERFAFAEQIAPRTRVRSIQDRSGQVRVVASEMQGLGRSSSVATKEMGHLMSMFDDLARGQIRQFVASLGSALRDAGRGAGTLAFGVGGLVAVMAGAEIFRSAENMGKWAHEVQAGSQAVGMSISQFSQLQGALTLTGAKSESAEFALRKFATSLSEAQKDPASKAAQALHAFGISQDEITKNGSNVFEMLLRVSDAMKTHATNTESAARAEVLFGTWAEEGLVRGLSGGSEALLEYMKKAHDVGITLDETTTPGLARTGDAIIELGARIRGDGIQAMEDWGPVIVGLVDLLEGLAHGIYSVGRAAANFASDVVKAQPEGFVPGGWEGTVPGPMPATRGRSSYYENVARAAAAKYGVPPEMFVHQMMGESGLNPNIGPSSAGALGIAQFMPITAAGIGLNPNDPVASLFAAAKMMADLEAKMGGWQPAMRAYAGARSEGRFNQVMAKNTEYQKAYEMAGTVGETPREGRSFDLPPVSSHDLTKRTQYLDEEIKKLEDVKKLRTSADDVAVAQARHNREQIDKIALERANFDAQMAQQEAAVRRRFADEAVKSGIPESDAKVQKMLDSTNVEVQANLAKAASIKAHNQLTDEGIKKAISALEVQSRLTRNEGERVKLAQQIAILMSQLSDTGHGGVLVAEAQARATQLQVSSLERQYSAQEKLSSLAERSFALQISTQKGITPQQKFGFEVEEVYKQAAILEKILDTRMKLATELNDDIEKEKITMQQLELQFQTQEKVLELKKKSADEDKKLEERIARPFTHAFDTIGNSIETAITNSLLHKGTQENVMKTLYQSLVGQGVHAVGAGLSVGATAFLPGSKPGEDLGTYLGHQVAELIIHTGLLTGILANTGTSAVATAAGAGTSALSAAGNAGGILSGTSSLFNLFSGGSSATASAGSSLIDLVGTIPPLARGAIVPSAAGGWALPHFSGMQPAMLHGGEMVLPKHISEGLQSMIGSGGSGDLNLHFHGPSDGPAVERWFTGLMARNPGVVRNMLHTSNALTPRTI